jgi:hypothetical protein
LDLGLESAAEGLLVVAEVPNFFSAFLDGPFVILVTVFEIDVTDEEGAEESGKGEVAENLGTAEPLSSE